LSETDLQEQYDAGTVQLKLAQIKIRGLLFKASEHDKNLAKLQKYLRQAPWWRKLLWSSLRRRRVANILNSRPMIEEYERLEKAGFFNRPPARS